MRVLTPAMAAAWSGTIILTISPHAEHQTGVETLRLPMKSMRSVSTVISIRFFVIKLPPRSF
jgi:hypothetical protein